MLKWVELTKKKRDNKVKNKSANPKITEANERFNKFYDASDNKTKKTSKVVFNDEVKIRTIKRNYKKENNSQNEVTLTNNELKFKIKANKAYETGEVNITKEQIVQIKHLIETEEFELLPETQV